MRPLHVEILSPLQNFKKRGTIAPPKQTDKTRDMPTRNEAPPARSAVAVCRVLALFPRVARSAVSITSRKVA